MGKSTYFATTCRECPAGCGLIVRTMEGRAIKAEGNPAHPVSRGKICSRGLTAVQGLYNPDRIKARSAAQRGETLEAVTWDEALADGQAGAVQPGWKAWPSYLGLNHDHLFDLVSELTQTIGRAGPAALWRAGNVRGRATLVKAARTGLRRRRLPLL